VKQYTYFPGCSSNSTAKALGMSVKAIEKPLDIELIELDDWNCCGSTPYGSLYEDEALLVAARNLALAEKSGRDLVTPCSSCFVVLHKANLHLKEDDKTRVKVNQALAAAGLEFHGKINVRLLPEVIFHDVTPEKLAQKVTKKLNGLKVASYYGCQMLRPYGFDNPEAPTSLDKIVDSLGGTAVPFQYKNRCCGGSLIIPEENSALNLMQKILANAVENGADCLITPCPLCQMNLDAYRVKVNSKFSKNYNIPVLFVSQLIGLAMGVDTISLGFKANVVSTAKVIDIVNTAKQAIDTPA
jgi:heterodisulfide reductase subunit B2